MSANDIFQCNTRKRHQKMRPIKLDFNQRHYQHHPLKNASMLESANRRKARKIKHAPLFSLLPFIKAIWFMCSLFASNLYEKGKKIVFLWRYNKIIKMKLPKRWVKRQLSFRPWCFYFHSLLSSTPRICSIDDLHTTHTFTAASQ